MKKLLCALSLSVLALANLAPAAAQNSEREFASGYAGVLPGEAKLLAREYFDDPAVRRLIYRIETSPARRSDVEEAIAGTGRTVADLVRVKILREEDGLYYIGFNYFTADDMRAIYAATDKYTPSLVAAFQARKHDFDRIFTAYPAHSVSKDALAFAIVAGFSLNWDGLQITEDNGWRKPDLVRGTGPDGVEWGYTFWAAENVAGHSVHGFYWGSSTFPGGGYNLENEPLDYAFTSFGDPYSDPRMNFPDLLYLPGEAMAAPVRDLAAEIGLADRSLFGGAFEIENALGVEIARPIGTILFALRERPRTTAQLRKIAGDETSADIGTLVALLEETGYVESHGGKHRLVVPVFDYADKETFDAAMALSREVLEGWLNENYAAIKDDLSGLTALGQGVAYESLFTQIWHDFFGQTTRDLAAAGFYADPAGGAVKYPGSLPVLWRTTLYELTLG